MSFGFSIGCMSLRGLKHYCLLCGSMRQTKAVAKSLHGHNLIQMLSLFAEVDNATTATFPHVFLVNERA